MIILDKNPLIVSISNWFRRNFSDPAAISLFMTLVLGLLFLIFFGKIFLPVLVSIVITYLLNSIVVMLTRWGLPHLFAVIIAYLVFIGLIVLAIVALLPLLWRELSNLVNELPEAFTNGQAWFMGMVKKYPKIFSDIQLVHVINFLREQSVNAGQIAIKYSLASIPGIIQVILYFVLVPLLVFFFLKDRDTILHWFGGFMPSERSLVVKVWAEVNDKIGAYIRGRIVEIIIVGFICSAVFAILGLQYALLLGVLVGLSVLIPYIGGVIVTIPVVIIALGQWGFSTQFVYLIVAYTIINVLDANLLVPLLFSGAMDLHPVAIILSVVLFGAIWGFWGIFFAIPLATLVNAVLKAWPRGVATTTPDGNVTIIVKEEIKKEEKKQKRKK